MKPGDLVKYNAGPYFNLQHLVGIVTSLNPAGYDAEKTIWVMWGHVRPQNRAGERILKEWIDELEVVSGKE